MVPWRRLELPRPYGHRYLKPARLPIPPPGLPVFSTLLAGWTVGGRCTPGVLDRQLIKHDHAGGIASQAFLTQAAAFVPPGKKRLYLSARGIRGGSSLAETCYLLDDSRTGDAGLMISVSFEWSLVPSPYGPLPGHLSNAATLVRCESHKGISSREMGSPRHAVTRGYP